MRKTSATQGSQVPMAMIRRYAAWTVGIWSDWAIGIVRSIGGMGCDVDPPGDQGSFDVLHDGSQLDADRAVGRGRDQGVRIVVQRRQQLGVADLQRALPRLSKGVGGDESVDPVSDQVLDALRRGCLQRVQRARSWPDAKRLDSVDDVGRELFDIEVGVD